MAKILPFVILIGFCSNLNAHPVDDVHTWQDYLLSNQTKVTDDELQEIYKVPDKLRWLFDELIMESDRITNTKFAERSFAVHLEDTYKKYPHPTEITNQGLKPSQTISGRVKYAGVVSKIYKYDYERLDEDLVQLTVKIHFKTNKEEDWIKFSQLLVIAQGNWERAVIRSLKKSVDFRIKFRFLAERTKANAHYSVNVLDDTRGPYDTNWSRSWSSRTVTHELGHMMGLGDEYNLITSKSECLSNYIMCSSAGAIQKMHSYFVLRRLVATN